ncbi:hypothetical protein [Salipiger mucosus]|uniref:Uncharacterized protein n=1 Tax=Salipiger mucosus DSM 16094 TaxID=1123237 RepID=S9QR53_9RHOB|nr:hypothetical protein [Salipiger mucosus]EPX83896.1 hypothetical protein Salmuc_01671 [Salipiger mucosus DSM 16094]
MTTDIEISEPELERAQYVIEIDQADLQAISEAEAEEKIDPADHLESRIVQRPRWIQGRRWVPDNSEVEGVESLFFDSECDGLIQYEVRGEDDTPELHERIRDIVREQVKVAREIAQQEDLSPAP